MGTRFRLNSLAGISLVAVLAIALSVALPPGPAWADAEDDAVAHHSRAVVFGSDAEMGTALAFLKRRGNPDAAAAMILALRYRQSHNAELSE